MKAVLMSIQPKWCELIASGKKTVEVRKTRPKLETPFKVYIYCTKDEPLYESGTKFFCGDEFGNGKVVGAFVCDYIEGYRAEFTDLKYFNSLNNNVCLNTVMRIAWREEDNKPYYVYETSNEEENPNDCNLLKDSCLTFDELRQYIGKTFCNKSFYGLHISDLVIYDEPRALSEFFYACDKPSGTDCSVCVDNRKDKCKSIKRPPRGWCYVEHPTKVRDCFEMDRTNIRRCT